MEKTNLYKVIFMISVRRINNQGDRNTTYESYYSQKLTKVDIIYIMDIINYIIMILISFNKFKKYYSGIYLIIINNLLILYISYILNKKVV